MHVLRIWLTSGTQIELLYRGKGDIRTAEHRLVSMVVERSEPLERGWLSLKDDFGKTENILADQVAGWQCSDYAAELEGALAIAQAKQEASDKHQREMQRRHSLLVPQGPQMPGNGHIIHG